MKKIIYILLFYIFILPFSALAAQNSGSTNAQSGQVNSNNVNASATVSTTQNRTQNQTEAQVQTNNPDIGTMAQEQTRTELQTELQKSQPVYAPVRQMTQTRLSTVSQVVENLVTLASRLYTQDQSLSVQIRTTAQEQIKAEDKVNQALDEAESRSKFARFFIGPNYKQLKVAKQEIEQNRLRVQQLNQIMLQITNASEQTELASQIKILETQNTSLEEQLNQDVEGFSLFGWLSKLISGF
jgi:hypothetical protein